MVTASAVATGALWLFMWALALNGFMGQERAVNVSMITFFVMTGIFSLASIALSVYSAYYLSVKRMWNAAGAAILSIVVFATAAGGLQLLSLFISVAVASQMRTTR
jgi:hypothetical protein